MKSNDSYMMLHFEKIVEMLGLDGGRDCKVSPFDPKDKTCFVFWEEFTGVHDGKDYTVMYINYPENRVMKWYITFAGMANLMYCIGLYGGSEGYCKNPLKELLSSKPDYEESLDSFLGRYGKCVDDIIIDASTYWRMKNKELDEEEDD